MLATGWLAGGDVDGQRRAVPVLNYFDRHDAVPPSWMFHCQSLQERVGIADDELDIIDDLMDDTVKLCKTVLEGSWNVAWKAGKLRLAMIEDEHLELQRQLHVLQRRPEDMHLACEYHRRCARYDADRAQIMQLSLMLESERTRWLQVGSAALRRSATAALLEPSCGAAGKLLPRTQQTAHLPYSPEVGRSLGSSATCPVGIGELTSRHFDSVAPALGCEVAVGRAELGITWEEPPMPSRARPDVHGLLNDVPERATKNGIAGPTASVENGAVGDHCLAQAPDPWQRHQWSVGVKAQPSCTWQKALEEQRAEVARHHAEIAAKQKLLQEVRGGDMAGGEFGGGVVCDFDLRLVQQRVQRHLEAELELRAHVAREFAVVSCGTWSVAVDGLRQVATALAERLGVPGAAFADLKDVYMRFDFNSDKSLQEDECFRLMRYLLREYCRQLGQLILEALRGNGRHRLAGPLPAAFPRLVLHA